jgi:hypothetical protein
MHADELRGGAVVQYSEPRWEPLLDAVGDTLAGRFMWMFEAQLDGGLALHAYKHQVTRQYLHLGEDGSHWVFVDLEPGTPAEQIQARRSTYRRFELSAALELVLGDWIDGLVGTPPDPDEREAFRLALAWAEACEDEHGASFGEAA